MKTLLALLLASALNAIGQVENSGPLIGDYLGIALPVGSCTSERLIVLISVKSDYTLAGWVNDWDKTIVKSFTSTWPYFSGHSFASTVTPNLESGAKGSFNAKAGSVSGILDLRPDGGCRYTFKCYRRLKNN